MIHQKLSSVFVPKTGKKMIQRSEVKTAASLKRGYNQRSYNESPQKILLKLLSCGLLYLQCIS